ncbi:hypothetical protein Dda_3040 [Drechslerella dactyloides]|uniref:Uncharacterized protein n=1 Tax=Drechslerella dactyloides TaxID=74499 RepID=A0AAD6J0Q5_DREDA|nr:hypothetical protein Dda_3040 [Drechslerella dactyloides]
MAYYEVTLREVRGEWFTHTNLFRVGNSISQREPGECYRYNNIKSRHGGELGTAVYNRPPTGMVAAIAFYTGASCGSNRGKHGEPQAYPHYKLAYVAVLNSASLPGVFFINFKAMLGEAAKFTSYRSLDYEAETKRGGLLATTGNDPSNVVYAFTENANGRVSRNRGYIEGVVEKLTGPEVDILDQLTDVSDIFLGVKDLAERALTPGSETIPNTVLDYLRRTLAGEYANGEPRFYLPGGLAQPDYGPPRMEKRRQEALQRFLSKQMGRQQTVEQADDGGVNEDAPLLPMSGDEEAQAAFLQFLDDPQGMMYEVEQLADSGDETPDDQRLVKANPEAEIFEEALESFDDPTILIEIDDADEPAPEDSYVFDTIIPRVEPLDEDPATPISNAAANAALADAFEYPVSQEVYAGTPPDLGTDSIAVADPRDYTELQNEYAVAQDDELENPDVQSVAVSPLQNIDTEIVNAVNADGAMQIESIPDDISIASSQFLRDLNDRDRDSPQYIYGPGIASTSTARDRDRQALIQQIQANNADVPGNNGQSLNDYLNSEDAMAGEGSYDDYTQFNAGRRRRLNPTQP